MNVNEAKNRTLSIERIFQAPIELVWDAWTQATHITQWWVPQGMDFKIISHDFRVGGKWEYKMSMPNGGEFISEGEYQEIVPHEKIITSADFKPMTEGVTLVALFEAEGDNTKFSFHVVHPTEEYCLEQEKMGFYNGWGSAFDRLDRFLSEKTNV